MTWTHRVAQQLPAVRAHRPHGSRCASASAYSPAQAFAWTVVVAIVPSSMCSSVHSAVVACSSCKDAAAGLCCAGAIIAAEHRWRRQLQVCCVGVQLVCLCHPRPCYRLCSRVLHLLHSVNVHCDAVHAGKLLIFRRVQNSAPDPRRTRTSNLQIWNLTLCQLS